MPKEQKLKVILLSYTKKPEEVVAAAIRQCYSPVGAEDLLKKTSQETRERLVKQIISSGQGEKGRNIKACLKKADYVLINKGTIKELEAKVEEILTKINA